MPYYLSMPCILHNRTINENSFSRILKIKNINNAGRKFKYPRFKERKNKTIKSKFNIIKRSFLNLIN